MLLQTEIQNEAQKLKTKQNLRRLKMRIRVIQKLKSAQNRSKKRKGKQLKKEKHDAETLWKEEGHKLLQTFEQIHMHNIEAI